MHGIIFDIKRFAVHDGPGIRTTVFLKGCPLKCQWCHNPESINKEPEQVQKTVWLNQKAFTKTETIGRKISDTALWEELQKDQIFMEESNGGITFSGGEPLMQHQFLSSMIRRCKRHGIHSCIDTSGFAHSNTIREMEMPDLFLFDIKHIDKDKHQQFTQVDNELILQNLRFILEKKIPVRIRIPVIPGFNHSEEDLEKIANYLTQWHQPIEQIDLLPFHAIANHK